MRYALKEKVKSDLSKAGKEAHILGLKYSCRDDK
jgi:hypothetical protein